MERRARPGGEVMGALDGWDGFHIVPVNDSAPHRDNAGCWCQPTRQFGDVWVHHSADGREIEETQANGD